MASVGKGTSCKEHKWACVMMDIFYMMFLLVVTFLPLLNAYFVIHVFVNAYNYWNSPKYTLKTNQLDCL